MAKWAFTADTQFDEQLSYATIGPDGLSSRLTDSIRCFNWIIDEALLRKCTGLFVLGDLFDSRTSIDVSVLDQVGRTFGRAVDEGLVLGLLPGNHDSYLRNSSVNSLWPFSGVAHIYEQPMVDGVFAFLPWIEDDDEFVRQVEYLSQDKGAEILLSHCMVEGAVPAAIGVGRPISMLNPKRWKQVLLGDVHEPIQVTKNVRYCGSPMQQHFGDAGRKRGFLILDDETGKIEFIENMHSPRFHLLDDVVSAGTVRKGDFVRVRTEDPSLAKKIVTSVLDLVVPARIETEAVELDEVEPRLQVHAKDPHEEVLRRFVEYSGFSNVDGLVELGLEILEEARHE